MQVLAFSGSTREQSFNRKLIAIAVDVVRAAAHEVELLDLNDYDMAIYNGDYENANGQPEATLRLAEKITEAQAIIISSPEYNHSIPPLLKNAIDWLSRLKPVPLRGKQMLLLSASPSLVGGNRGLWNLRMPLEYLGTDVYPDMFSLAEAHKAFDDDGKLKEEKQRERLEKLLGEFLVQAEKLK